MKKVLTIIFLLVSVISTAQEFSAGPDQTICLGNTGVLQGTGPGNYTYLWTSVPPDPTISDPTSLTPEVQPTTTTVYTLEGRSVALVNSVVNGNFETGDNTGFTSSYTYMPGPNGSIYNEGTYAITTDASNNHPNFSCNQDHTTGSGYFMAVNGSGTPNTVVWEQTVSVTPNTDYEFSTWVMSLSPTSPAVLQFSINGVLLGEPFNAASTTCNWNMFFEDWNSGITNSATISIVNQNTAGNGNDFSLDDIKFRKVTYHYDDCEVFVVPVPTSDFDLPVETCSLDTTIVTYTGTASASATYNWDFGGAAFTGSGPGPYKLIWPTIGQKTVSLTVEDGCPSPVSTKNIEVLQSPIINVTANPQTIPYGTTSELIGSYTGHSGTPGFEWQPADSVVDPDDFRTDTRPLRATTLFTFICTNTTNGCSSMDTVTVFVVGGPLGIIDYTASPDTICHGDSSVLSVNVQGGSGNYINSWTSDPPGFSHSGPESQLTVYPSETTIYYVSSDDGNTSTGMDSVEVVVLPQIVILNQPSDTSIDAMQSVIFEVVAENQLSFQWQVSEDNGVTWADITDNSIYSGAQTTVLTITDATADLNGNMYRCVIANECDPVTSDEALLTVVDSPDIVGNLDNADVCQLDTIFVPCSLTNFNNIDSFNLVFTFDTAYLSYLETAIHHPQIQNTTDIVWIDTIALNWSSVNGATIADGVFFDLVFLAKTGGQTEVQSEDAESILRNSYGFFPELIINSSQIEITSLPIGPDSAIVYPDSLNLLDEVDIDLEALGGEGDYVLWTIDSCGGDSVGVGQNLSISKPEQTTTYFAQWTNICGYTECKSATIKIIEQYTFAVPNAFTPNNDGKNDKFGIISPSILPVFKLSIFNRWGQLVFSSEDQNEYWDGTHNGESSPMGVYIWKTNYQYRTEGKGSEVHEEMGTVTLIR